MVIKMKRYEFKIGKTIFTIAIASGNSLSEKYWFINKNKKLFYFKKEPFYPKVMSYKDYAYDGVLKPAGFVYKIILGPIAIMIGNLK